MPTKMPHTALPRITVIAERVKLLDQNGELLRMLTAAEAATLLSGHRVSASGTKTRIRALRYLNEDRGKIEEPLKLRQTGLADPHRRESETNPKGCYTFDRLPRDSAQVFTHVVDGVITKWAA